MFWGLLLQKGGKVRRKFSLSGIDSLIGLFRDIDELFSMLLYSSWWDLWVLSQPYLDRGGFVDLCCGEGG